MTATAGRAHHPRLGIVSVPDETCDHCGAEAVGRTHGPDLPYCADHHEDVERVWAAELGLGR